MINKNLFSFSYLPLTIELECLENTNLPGYLGSALRGALGMELVKTPLFTIICLKIVHFSKGNPM